MNDIEKYVSAEDAVTPPTWTKWNKNLKVDQDSSNGNESFGNTSARSFASMLTDVDREDKSTEQSMQFDMSGMHDNRYQESQRTMRYSEAEKEMVDMKTLLQAQTDFIKKLSDLTKTQATLISTLTTRMEQMTMAKEQDYTGQEDSMQVTEPRTISDRVSTLDERTAIIDARTSKLIDMVSSLFDAVAGETLKRTKPDNEIDANTLTPPNKRADKKQTPTKKSPPFGKAMNNQNP